MVNLYSIFDSESGMCLGNNKTASQISDLLGVKINNVYPAATRGQLLDGKYNVKITGVGKRKKTNMDAETIRVMEEWEDVTEKLRRYFNKTRKEIGK